MSSWHGTVAEAMWKIYKDDRKNLKRESNISENKTQKSLQTKTDI